MPPNATSYIWVTQHDYCFPSVHLLSPLDLYSGCGSAGHICPLLAFLLTLDGILPSCYNKTTTFADEMILFCCILLATLCQAQWLKLTIPLSNIAPRGCIVVHLASRNGKQQYFVTRFPLKWSKHHREHFGYLSWQINHHLVVSLLELFVKP